MTCIEITGENAKEVVDMVVGIFGPRIVVPVEGDKDEPVRKMPEPEELSDAGDVQAKEGLGKASAEAEEDTSPVEELIMSLFAAGNNLRVIAEGEDFENFNEIADICSTAARALDVVNKLMVSQMKLSASAAVELVKTIKEGGSK